MDNIDNIVKDINQIKSQLTEIELKEQANQQEQANISRYIVELEENLKEKQHLRNKLDQEALNLHTQVEKLKPKLDKLERIAHLSQEFLDLHAECEDNQDLLKTLYSSVSKVTLKDDNNNNKPNPTQIELEGYTVIPEALEPENNQANKTDNNHKTIKTNKTENNQANKTDNNQANKTDNNHKTIKTNKTENNNYENFSISIEEIRKALPNAEKVYQQLVANNLEEYKTFQNFIVDGLDLIWYAVAFITYGRSAYRKMGFKYHPDLDGSERAMQLINTAWSISQNFEKNSLKPVDNVNTL